MNLNLTDKHDAILKAPGHCLVLGGPGSGKTTLALLKAANRIRQRIRPGQRILFLSFSRAAVARIAEAIKSQLCVSERSLLSVHTFHSFCWDIVQVHGNLLGCPKRLSIVPSHEEKALREGIEPGDAAWSEWEMKRLQLFTMEGRVCFDLFAPLAERLLSESKRIRNRVSSRYPLILIDEAQDTNESQWCCAETLAEKSQIVCLADLDQLIFDHLPGVGAERVERIRKKLRPMEIDLGQQNNRSPGTEIAVFARDVLNGRVRGSPYANVTRIRFHPRADDRDRWIRQSIGIISRTIKESTGHPPESIALIASYGSGVAIISAALRKEAPIEHHVLFDEAFVLLAARAGAFLLEPKESAAVAEDTAVLLDLLAEAYRARGNLTSLAVARRFSALSEKIRVGKTPNVKIVTAIKKLLKSSADAKYSGDPKRDWLRVKSELRSSGEEILPSVASSLDYLVAFGRGERIAAELSQIWITHGCYEGARKALDLALTQEQLIAGADALRGIHVMNIHKCKGKQFDGVVLYRAQHTSPFVWPRDPEPHLRSRRLLHVAITRAKSQVLILDEVLSACPILDPHVL